MSKKNRKGRAPNLPAAAYGTPAEASALASVRPAGQRAPVMPKPAVVKAVNWQSEYGEVLGDLKRTGLIAVILLGAMIALSFVF